MYVGQAGITGHSQLYGTNREAYLRLGNEDDAYFVIWLQNCFKFDSCYWKTCKSYS